MDMDEKERRGYLKDEYLFLQNQYEDYDKRSLLIKGWVSSGSIAAIAIAMNNPSKYSPLIAIFVAILTGVFWYLEAHWKLFQYALANRIRVIEAHFRNDQEILLKNPDPFQIYSSWFRSYRRYEPLYEREKGRALFSPHYTFGRVAFQRFVCLPYIVIIALSALSFVVTSK